MANPASKRVGSQNTADLANAIIRLANPRHRNDSLAPSEARQVALNIAQALVDEYNSRPISVPTEIASQLTNRQVAEYAALAKIADDYGLWTAGSGTIGANYTEDNPGHLVGRSCQNCVFYKGDWCGIVAVQPKPWAICRLGIIPESATANRIDSCDCGCPKCQESKKRKKKVEDEDEEIRLDLPPELERKGDSAEDEDIDKFIVIAQKETRKAVGQWISAIGSWIKKQSSLEAAATIIDEPEVLYKKLKAEPFANTLVNAMMVADLYGQAEVLGEIRRTDTLSDSLLRLDAPEWFKLPFDEALDLWRKRIAMPMDAYKQLEDSYRKWAFSVTGVHKAEILNDAKWLIDRAIADGTSLEDFQRQWARLIGRKTGWMPNEARIRVIYDTNLRSAYSQGRVTQMLDPEIQKRRPYFIWRWRDSNQPRENHKALHNKAIRSDDKLWEKVSFPAGFGCFTGQTLVSTPSGLRRIDSLSVGDLVFGGSGNVNTVSAVHTTDYTGQIVRTVVKERDGSLFAFSATPDHRVLTTDGWVESSKLKLGQKIIKTDDTPIPKSIATNQAISHVEHSYAGSAKSRMPCPVSRSGKSEACDALNPNIQAWDENIHPEAKPVLLDVVIINNRKTSRLQIPYHLLFDGCRFHASVSVKGRVFSVSFDLSDPCFFSHYGIKERTTSFQLFGGDSSTGTSVLVSSKSRMGEVGRTASPEHDIFRLRSSSFIALPLQSDCIGGASCHPIEGEKSKNDPVVNLPFLTQFPGCHLVFDVSQMKCFLNLDTLNTFNSLNDLNTHAANMLHPQSSKRDLQRSNHGADARVLGGVPFGDLKNRHPLFYMQIDEDIPSGASLDFFNSFDQIRDWALSSHSYTTVVDVSFEQSHDNISVYDISAYPDHSYNLAAGVAHNCRCGIFAVSEDYVKRSGVEVLDPAPDADTIIEPNFQQPLRGLSDDDRERITEGMKSHLPESLKKLA